LKRGTKERVPMQKLLGLTISKAGAHIDVRSTHVHSGARWRGSAALVAVLFAAVSAALLVWLRGLTFELRRPLRQATAGRARKMSASPWSGQTLPAVAGRLERGVRLRQGRWAVDRLHAVLAACHDHGLRERAKQQLPPRRLWHQAERPARRRGGVTEDLPQATRGSAGTRGLGSCAHQQRKA
jgi:hypothetical protein